MSVLMKKTIKFLTSPGDRFQYLYKKGFYRSLSDREYLERLFELKTGYKLNLEAPQTFNEKIQWLKLYDHRPEYTTMVDKYAVKQWVADRIGEKYIIPTLGVWDRFDDIDFNALPESFVLKCTHDSGSIVLVPDKIKMDMAAARKKLEKGLRTDYYFASKEWPYKNVPHRIIAEPYLTDESGTELKDYKIFSFGGEPKIAQVDYGRFAEHKRNLYTTDWQYIEAAILYPTDPGHEISKPKCLQEMLELSRKLSAGYPHVRTDFYYIDDKILFGELTLLHGSGFEPFTPPEFDLQMGQWLKLPSGGGILTTNNIILYIRLQEMRAEIDQNPSKHIVPEDYKVYCLNGKPKYIVVFHNRFNTRAQLSETVYDINWQPQHISLDAHFAVSDIVEPKPTCLDELLRISTKLAKDLPQVRVDWYIIENRIYFGEITLYTAGGVQPMIPPEIDLKMGQELVLPKIKDMPHGKEEK